MQLKYLPNIKSPNDLKKLDSEELHILYAKSCVFTPLIQ